MTTELVQSQEHVAELRSRGLLVADESAVIEEGVSLVKVDESHPVRVGAGSRIAGGATVHAGAEIGSNTNISGGSTIGERVVLGTGNIVLEQSVLTGPLTVGDDNKIGPFASIGQPAQDRSFEDTNDGPGVVIGSRNVIREFTTVHQPTTGQTQIGDSCYLMAYAHIPHDAVIGDFVTVTNSCQIAGHTRIHHHATLGLGVTVHQFSVLGAGVMIGMGLSIARDVPPYGTVVRAGIRSLNRVGMKRLGLSSTEIRDLEDWYKSNNGVVTTDTLKGHSDRWWYSDMSAFLEQSTRKHYTPLA